MICEGTGEINPERVAAATKNWMCVDCGNPASSFYRVRNSVWRETGVKEGKLCIPCLDRRVRQQLGRPLRIEDFPDTHPVNHQIHIGYRMALEDLKDAERELMEEETRAAQLSR